MGEPETFLLSLGSLGIVHHVFGTAPGRLVPVRTEPREAEGPDYEVW